MTIVFITIITFLIYSYILINNQNKKIRSLESILDYYRWHSALFEEPPHSGKYLLQIGDNKENITVSRYDIKKRMWDFSNQDEIVAWCRLPNYLYPKKEF